MARVKIGNVYPSDKYLLERCAPTGYGLGTSIGTISAGSMANFAFNGGSNIALISVRGPMASSFGSFLVSGYGIGGEERVNVTPLQSSKTVLFGICPQGTDSWGVTIWNNNTSEVYVNVLVLFGKMPTFNLNSDGGATPTEYEYENPPMRVGVEYRTTERWKDKPVYRKLVTFDALPNNTTGGVWLGVTGATAVVDYSVTTRNSENKTFCNAAMMSVVTGSYAELNNSGDIMVVLETNTDASHLAADCIVRYVK